MPPFDLLRSSRDDQARATILDSVGFSEAEEQTIEHHLAVLKQIDGVGEQGAKALLASLTKFVNLPEDARRIWEDHGKFVHRQFEWADRKESK